MSRSVPSQSRTGIVVVVVVVVVLVDDVDATGSDGEGGVVTGGKVVGAGTGFEANRPPSAMATQ